MIWSPKKRYYPEPFEREADLEEAILEVALSTLLSIVWRRNLPSPMLRQWLPLKNGGTPISMWWIFSIQRRKWGQFHWSQRGGQSSSGPTIYLLSLAPIREEFGWSFLTKGMGQMMTCSKTLMLLVFCPFSTIRFMRAVSIVKQQRSTTTKTAHPIRNLAALVIMCVAAETF